MSDTRAQIDVVIPLGTGSSWYEHQELRYCLRALERNFLSLRNVVIVGQRPGWLTQEAVHIPADDPLPHNKDGNIIRKILLACTHAGLSKQFVRCSDDELFLKPTVFEDMQAFYEMNLRRIHLSHQKSWRGRLRRTASYLESVHSLPTFMFDCHAPVPMNKERFVEIMASAPWNQGSGLCVDSLYFNLSTLHPRARLDDQLARLRTPDASLDELVQLARGARYLNYNDHALTPALQQFLEQTFSAPCRFELP